MRHFSRRVKIGVGLVLALGVSLGVGWRVWSTWGYRSAAGSYIAEGGSSWIVIEANRRGGLRVINGGFHPIHGDAPERSPLKARYRFGKLLITQTNRWNYEKLWTWSGEATIHSLRQLCLKKSASTPGNWDLVDASAQSFYPLRFSLKDISDPRTYYGIYNDPGESVDYLLGKYYYAFVKTSFMGGTLEPSHAPLRSFLHRLNAPKLSYFFQMRRSAGDPRVCLSILKEMIRDNPDNPFLELHQIELEAQCDNVGEAERLLALWDHEHGPAADTLLDINRQIVWKEIQSRKQRALFPDLVSFEEVFLYKSDPSGSGQDRRIRSEDNAAPWDWSLPRSELWFRELGRSGMPQYLGGSFVPNISTMEELWGEPLRISWLEIDYRSQVFLALAMFRLAEGKKEEALEILLGLCVLGKNLSSELSLLHRLHAVSLCGKINQGLEIWTLNSSDDTRDMLEIGRRLEKLDTESEFNCARNVLLGDYAPIVILMRRSGWTFGDYGPENGVVRVVTNFLRTHAHFQLIRAAAAARHRFLSTGAFPSTAEEFAPLLPSGPPLDPFVEAQSLAFRMDGDDFLLYSYGPDKSDNGGLLVYDPTNGVSSAGDILVRVPPRRKYPFPREGIRAANAAELLTQFPNGLPPDPFHDLKDYSLSILDATTTRGVAIFSFGPWTAMGSEKSPVAWPGVPRQWVFREETDPDPISSADGRDITHNKRNLKEHYDPTNGTTSKGDLFIFLKN